MARQHLASVAGRALGDFAGISVLGIGLSLLGLGALAAAARAQDEYLLEWVFALSMLVVLLAWDRRRPLPPAVAPVRRAWPARQAVLVGILAGCVLLLQDRLVLWLLELAGLGQIQAANDEPIRNSLAQAPLATTVQVGLLAPWLEERFIRGRLFGRFRNGGHALAGAVATSTLFALLHEFAPDEGQRLGEWLALIGLYAWSGLVFCLLYAWSGRLRMAIAAHATNNLVLCALFWLEGIA